jgi:hypothetical protein
MGGFQPQQAAAHHHAAARAVRSRADQVQVVERAVHQARCAFRARDRRHEGVGARRKYQFVVGAAAARGHDLAPAAVNLQHRRAQVQGHAFLFIQRRVAQRHRFGVASVQVFGQVHAVVGAAAFFAVDVDAVARKRAAGDELFDAMVAHHAVADDDEGLQRIG